MLGDDLMEHGVLGVAGPVDHLLEGHGPHVGARPNRGTRDVNEVRGVKVAF